MLHTLAIHCPICQSHSLTEHEPKTCTSFGYGTFHCKACEQLFEAKLVYTTREATITPTSPTKPGTDLRVQPTIHIGDSIRLAAKTPYAQEQLDKYGEWWKIKGGVPARISEPNTRPESWFISSEPFGHTRRDMECVHPGLYLAKANDHHFIVIDICVFPKDFKRSDYK